MLYALLCYNSEDIVGSWSKEEDGEVMARLTVINDRLQAAGQARPDRAADAHHGGDHGAQVHKGRRLEPAANRRW